ncbi:hypothetical protein CCACVL1_01180, partial [Corchorus capsularis]
MDIMLLLLHLDFLTSLKIWVLDKICVVM